MVGWIRTRLDLAVARELIAAIEQGQPGDTFFIHERPYEYVATERHVALPACYYVFRDRAGQLFGLEWPSRKPTLRRMRAEHAIIYKPVE